MLLPLFLFSLDGSSDVLSKDEETHVLINAIKSANLPKFLSDDVVMFEKILADIFPYAKVPSTDHTALEVKLISY